MKKIDTIGPGYNLFAELQTINPQAALEAYICLYTGLPETEKMVEQHRTLFIGCSTGEEAYRVLTEKFFPFGSPAQQELDVIIGAERPSAAMFAECLVTFIRKYHVPASFFLTLNHFFQVLGMTKKRRVPKMDTGMPKKVKSTVGRMRAGVLPAVEQTLLHDGDWCTVLDLQQAANCDPATVERVLQKLSADRRFLLESRDREYRLARTTLWYERMGEEVPDGAPSPRPRKGPGRPKREPTETTGYID